MKITRFKDPATKRWKYRADFTCGGVRCRPVADTSEELYDEIDAIRRRARRRRLGLPVERRAVSLDELVAERTRDFDLRLQNRRRARTVLLDFASRLPGRVVEEVTAADLRDYARARKAEFLAAQAERELIRKRRSGRDYVPRAPLELSPHSLNKELNFISGMLRAAPGLFDELADYRPPKVPWAPIPRRLRRRPVSYDEDESLLAALRAPRGKGERANVFHARGEVADLFELWLLTGMRPGETTRLTWPQIDFDAREIYLGRTKNGEDRFVPMNTRVVEIMRGRRESGTSRYVFPNPDGTRPRCDYYGPLRRVARSLGLPYGQRVENGFTPYSARHTAVTRMLRAGHDISSVQEIVGHSNATMALHYSHATRASTHGAAESLVRRPPAKNPPAEEEAGPQVEQLEHVEAG